MRNLTALFVLLFFAFTSAPQRSKGHLTPTKWSPRRFVENFYARYTPAAAEVSSAQKWKKERSWTYKALSPTLARSLRLNDLANSTAAGVSVGIDFDPFLGTQDPESKYFIGKIARVGQRYLANVYSRARRAANQKADVIAEFENAGGHWRFTNFHYSGRGNLVGILHQLSARRAIRIATRH